MTPNSQQDNVQGVHPLHGLLAHLASRMQAWGQSQQQQEEQPESEASADSQRAVVPMHAVGHATEPQLRSLQRSATNPSTSSDDHAAWPFRITWQRLPRFGRTLDGAPAAAIHDAQPDMRGLPLLPAPHFHQALPLPLASVTASSLPSPDSSPAPAWSPSHSPGSSSVPFSSSSSLLLAPPPSYSGANSKAELGRATWTLLHTLAAQFPDRPTRQQQRDAKQLVEALTRVYPCAECARHFQEIVKRDPPMVSSGQELQLWMCRIHNSVNKSIGKPTFNCELVTARWAPLDCGEGDAAAPSACDMSLGSMARGKK